MKCVIHAYAYTYKTHKRLKHKTHKRLKHGAIHRAKRREHTFKT